MENDKNRYYHRAIEKDVINCLNKLESLKDA